jgi:hypothetical protein
LGAQQTVWAFTASQYSGVSFWAMNQANITILQNGGTFQGYHIDSAGQPGMNFPSLPAGTWCFAAVANVSISQGQTYSGFDEVSIIDLPGAVTTGNVAMAVGGNAGYWQTKPFTIVSGKRTYIETEGNGGKFAILDSSGSAAFTAANSNGYTGGSYTYIYACGGKSGGPATEIECEMQLPPGNYVLLYVNDSGSWAGGAANIAYYQ